MRLRDGRPARIRSCVEADAAALYAMEQRLVADGSGQVRLADDLPAAEVFSDRIFSRIAQAECWLVVEVEGSVVAAGSVRRYGPARIRHVATLELGVHPELQGMGVGRGLTRALIDGARGLEVERLELNVRADNARAIGLYRSLGFVRESVRERFVKLDMGRYVDDWLMLRWLT